MVLNGTIHKKMPKTQKQQLEHGVDKFLQLPITSGPVELTLHKAVVAVLYLCGRSPYPPYLLIFFSPISQLEADYPPIRGTVDEASVLKMQAEKEKDDPILKQKELGNEFFKSGKYAEAARSYAKGIEYDPDDKNAYVLHANRYVHCAKSVQLLHETDQGHLIHRFFFSTQFLTKGMKAPYPVNTLPKQ